MSARVTRSTGRDARRCSAVPRTSPPSIRAFRAWWQQEHALALAPTEARELTLAFDAEGDDSDADDGDGDVSTPTLSVRYSRAEVLRERDFAAYTPAEFAEARKLMADIRLAGAFRRSRRTRPTNRRRGRPDLRRTVRRALRAGGEPINRAFVEPATRRAVSCFSAT